MRAGFGTARRGCRGPEDEPMTDPRALPDDRPNVAHDPLEEEIAELQGEVLPTDQDVVLDPDSIETARQPTLSEQAWGVAASPDLRSGETDDPLVAIEEGQTYVPPSDPPVVASDDPQGAEVPAAVTDDAEGDMNARIRDELRSDAATSALADRLQIAVIGATAILRGQIDGIEDADALVEVVGRVDGIEDVRDETEVVGLD
jgi:hypothetical protein